MQPRTNSQFLAASVTEFISVWAIGGDASLNFTTKCGFKTIGFKCTIRHPGAPHSLPPSSSSAPSFPAPPPRQPCHRSPSEREKNKQRAARHQAAKAGATDSVSATVTQAPSVTAPVITLTVTPPLTLDKGTQSDSFLTEPVIDNLDSTNCDQCDFISKSSNGLKLHTRKKHRISQKVGNNEVTESEEITEKDLSFNHDDFEFTSKEEQDLWRHTERVHFQCAEFDLKFNSESCLKLHRKEKHCDSCGKVVTSYWHHKYLPRGNIYDVCGPDCYVEFFNETVKPLTPPGHIYG